MTARKRAPVLLVAQTGTLGGAERVLLDWSGALDPPVVLACPPGPLAAAAAARGVDVVALADRPMQRRGRSARAAGDLAALGAEIARAARRHRPAVVVASGLRPVLAAAAAPLAGAALVTVHHDLLHPAAATAARAAARRGAAAIAVSGAVAEQLRGHPAPLRRDEAASPAGRAHRNAPTHHGGAPPRGRVIVIHPGVDTARWELPDPPAGPPRALVLGALVPWKRADLALEIAALLPELRLDVAGAPIAGDALGHEAALHARAAQPDLAGRVRFLGALDDPRPALAEAHALLHCADREPFGLVLVEALAAGRPVAAPAAGGPLEIVTPACGRLYAPGSAAGGAEALRAVLRAPDAAAARARAARFDLAASASRFGALVAAVARR
jgi:glycosyltransferase involved in cell wall biosynthesis